MLERLNEEIKRRTYVLRIFPSGDGCLRQIRALTVEIHEGWLEAHRYLNMEDLPSTRRSSSGSPPHHPMNNAALMFAVKNLVVSLRSSR